MRHGWLIYLGDIKNMYTYFSPHTRTICCIVIHWICGYDVPFLEHKVLIESTIAASFTLSRNYERSLTDIPSTLARFDKLAYIIRDTILANFKNEKCSSVTLEPVQSNFVVPLVWLTVSVLPPQKYFHNKLSAQPSTNQWPAFYKPTILDRVSGQ